MQSKITIVTALVDLQKYDEGVEKKFAERNFNKYYSWLKQTLEVQADFCVFINRNKHNDLQRYRSNHAHQLKLFPFDGDDLLISPHYPKIKDIIEKKYPVDRPKRPEMKIPEYNAMMFSKIDVVMHAIKENPFDATHFMWLDAGFGHGLKTSHAKWILDSNWPNNNPLNDIDSQIVVNQIRKFKRKDFSDRKKYYRSHTTRIAGNIWCGEMNALKIYHDLFQKTIHETLGQGIMDDDQSIMYDCLTQKPDLFYTYKSYNLWSHDWLGLTHFFK